MIVFYNLLQEMEGIFLSNFTLRTWSGGRMGAGAGGGGRGQGEGQLVSRGKP